MGQSPSSLSRQQVNAYRTQQVATAPPGELVLHLLDLVAQSCAARDRERAVRGLMELVNALDFDAGEVALGLLRLHHYCLELVHRGGFDEAQRIVSELRTVWSTALQRAGALAAGA